MPQAILKNAEERMKKAIDVLKKELASLRAGRATPALLDRVMVEYYGTPTPVNQLATISAPEPRLLVIQPWDKSVIGEIEKAIQKSDLGLTPMNDGNVIRIAIPPLTEERRAELAKVVKKHGEEAKVAIRNIRRDANDELKGLEKDGQISEDELRRHQESVQKLTDKYTAEVEAVVEAKEKEIFSL
ncbi:MAG: ribosome recycling factor [Calditerricola sp.]|jgi:ribosome recycling factor|nr:ribosome recycling factor [Bacillota bacterium]MCG0314855.1 ribosome recycling factor [Calditerricola sp.]